MQTTGRNGDAVKVVTRITKLLDIDYPIILAAMASVTTAEMVAAVSHAGALGFLVLTLELAH